MGKVKKEAGLVCRPDPRPSASAAAFPTAPLLGEIRTLIEQARQRLDRENPD